MSCSQDGQSETIAFQQLTRHGRSHNIYLPAPESPALIQFIHVSIRGEWKRGLRKKPFFITATWIIYLWSLLLHTPSIPGVFLQQEEQSSGLVRQRWTRRLISPNMREDSRDALKHHKGRWEWTKQVKNWCLISAASQLLILNTRRVSCRFARLQRVRTL